MHLVLGMCLLLLMLVRMMTMGKLLMLRGLNLLTSKNMVHGWTKTAHTRRPCRRPGVQYHVVCRQLQVGEDAPTRGADPEAIPVDPGQPGGEIRGVPLGAALCPDFAA